MTHAQELQRLFATTPEEWMTVTADYLVARAMDGNYLFMLFDDNSVAVLRKDDMAVLACTAQPASKEDQ